MGEPERRRFARPDRRWLVAATLGGIVLAALVAVVLTEARWWTLLYCAGLPASGFTYWRRLGDWTEFGPDEILVSSRHRRRRVPPGDVAGVSRVSRYSPVVVQLRTGEAITLPGVEPEDFDEVRRLLPHAG